MLSPVGRPEDLAPAKLQQVKMDLFMGLLSNQQARSMKRQARAPTK